MRTEKDSYKSEKAHAIRYLSGSEILEKYPDLAAAVAVMSVAMERAAAIEDPRVRSLVVEQIRMGTAASVEAGKVPPPVSIQELRPKPKPNAAPPEFDLEIS